MPEDSFMSLPELARQFGLHSETIRKMASSVAIPAYKLGKSWVFINEEIKCHLQKNQQNNEQLSN